jgi:predicted amidohydrolase YtcJ
MAFGFFKKNEVADTIFMGGKIFTQNYDFPWAEAVACRDGIVLAAGDYEDISEFEGKHTEVVDLNGRFLLPGYIDTCGHPSLKAFADSCLFLMNGDLESIISQIADYAAENSDAPVIFAYGYEDTVFKEHTPEQARALLDELNTEKPVMIIEKNGFQCRLNTVAMDMVKAAAEEDEVKTISLLYVFHVLEPIDLNTVPGTIPQQMVKYCERGFTSVFDCGSPECFAASYQSFLVHLYQEDMLKQRYYGSLLISTEVNPDPVMRRLSQFRTTCTELDGHINFHTLKLVVDRTEERNSLSYDTLKALCLEACDKGFDVHIDAIGKEAVFDAVEALEAARSAGYRKNSFTVAHNCDLDPEDLADTGFRTDIKESAQTFGITEDDWLCIEGAKSVTEAVEMLTINAAVQLGVSDDFGSIEKGKHADFTVFEENPLEAPNLQTFKKLQSVMTIIDGKVAYDAEEDDLSQWYAMLSMQQY